MMIPAPRGLALAGFSLIVLTVALVSSKSHRSLPKCQLDECQLKPAHYTLYAYIKQAIESNFDLRGKEIYPLIRSVEHLRRRFEGDKSLNGTSLIESLLANETLKEALRVFASDEGSSLIDLYRSSINGRSQNLACSQLRTEALERATKKLESNQQLALVFIKIHENFVRQSVKKCLKHACNSVDVTMSRLDSTLMAKHQAASITWEEIVNNRNRTSNETTCRSRWTREFAREELELCQLLQRNNQSDCQISASELSEISLLKGRQEEATGSFGDGNNNNNKTSPSLSDYLASFYENKLAGPTTNSSVSASQTKETSNDKRLEQAARQVLADCRAMRGLLDYNLAGLRWYGRQGVMESHKLATRSFWCPSLAYWLQVDRLCQELESSLTGSSSTSNGTFSYEVTTNHHHHHA